jgi:hypothetical protein
MTSVRSSHNAILLVDGRVLILGGDLTSAELYDPISGTFQATGSTHLAGMVGGATRLTDGAVFTGAELYRPATGTFTSLRNATGHEYASTATLLMDGTVLIAGGGNSDPATCLANVELYIPLSGTFAPVQNLGICRYSHTATLLPDGRVLIAGGASYAVGPYQANLNQFELYDPSTKVFAARGPLTAGRQAHTATLLLDGKVLLAGGFGGAGYSSLSTAEIYNPLATPLLYSLSGDGRGQGAIQHANSEFASVDHPAIAGETLAVYLSGMTEGSVIPPDVAIGGRMADVVWFGNVPGAPGLNQINVRVPGGVAPGPAVPVRLTYLGRSSNEVTIAVR